MFENLTNLLCMKNVYFSLSAMNILYSTCSMYCKVFLYQKDKIFRSNSTKIIFCLLCIFFLNVYHIMYITCTNILRNISIYIHFNVPTKIDVCVFVCILILPFDSMILWCKYLVCIKISRIH